MWPPARRRRGRAPPSSTVSAVHRWVVIKTMDSWKLTLVPPTKMPPRAPFGPSLVLTAGMFLDGIDFVLQKSAAVRRDTCCMLAQWPLDLE